MVSRTAVVRFIGPDYVEVKDTEGETHYLPALQIVTTLWYCLREGMIVHLEYFGDPGVGDWNLIEIVEY